MNSTISLQTLLFLSTFSFFLLPILHSHDSRSCRFLHYYLEIVRLDLQIPLYSDDNHCISTMHLSHNQKLSMISLRYRKISITLIPFVTSADGP